MHSTNGTTIHTMMISTIKGHSLTLWKILSSVQMTFFTWFVCLLTFLCNNREMVESMAFLRKRVKTTYQTPTGTDVTYHSQCHGKTRRHTNICSSERLMRFQKLLCSCWETRQVCWLFLSFFPLSSSLWSTASQRVFGFCVVCVKSRKFPRRLVAKNGIFLFENGLRHIFT